MRVLLQRVSQASVEIAGVVTGQIGRGYCLLVGFTHGDSPVEAEWMAGKICGLRLFPDDEGKMNRDLRDVGGAILVVSQFTLYGDVAKGRRPSFNEAACPETATPLYKAFCSMLAASGFEVATGRFGAEMLLKIHNDGPVTLMLERHVRQPGAAKGEIRMVDDVDETPGGFKDYV